MIGHWFEESLCTLFAPFGKIQPVTIVTDRDTGKARGLAFVGKTQDEEAQKAIAALNGKDFEGRMLKVNEARPKWEASNRPRPAGNYPRQKARQVDYWDFPRKAHEHRW